MRYDFFEKQVHIGDYVFLRKYVAKNCINALCIGKVVKFNPTTIAVEIIKTIEGYDIVLGKIANVHSDFTIKLSEEQCNSLH